MSGGGRREVDPVLLRRAALAVVAARVANPRVLINSLRVTPVAACELLEALQALGVVSPWSAAGRYTRKVLVEAPCFLPAELQDPAALQDPDQSQDSEQDSEQDQGQSLGDDLGGAE